MPRGKDAPTQVGGQIDPYVQRSIQQSKQLAESRLVTAMQETGATGRAQIAAGARGGGDSGVAAERARSAGQLALADKQAVADERAKREDRKYAQTMTEASQKFQAKQAELGRDFQIARQEKDWKRTDELEKKRDAYRRFDSRARLQASKENINALLTMTKGIGNRALLEERVKTTMTEELDTFDEDKKVYETVKEKVIEAVEFDKRMDLPARKPRATFRGAGAGMTFALPEESMEKLADPMGILQDQIVKREGKISVEDLSSANIYRVAEQMQAGELKTEDINATLGVLEGMQEIVGEKRLGLDRKSDEFDFWQNTYLDISQFVDNLEGLVNKTKMKITGSKTETVGSVMEYSLGTIKNRSLGGQASRYKELMGGSLEGLLEDWTKSIQVPALMPISDDMSKEEIEIINEHNDDLIAIYPELGVE